MSHSRRVYWVCVTAAAILVVLAAIPIVASDLFREPYHPLWRTINDVMARLQVTYNPSGGGLAPQFPRWRDPADAMIYFREVTLTTSDDLQIAAWWVPAQQAGAPTMLLAHGLLDSKWTLLRLVPWLHEAGYHVMLLDFRGHGGSSKEPTSVGPDEVADVQAALDWLEAEGAADRVAGLGMSLGAAALLNTAVQDERLDALVLDSLFAEWADVNYAEDYRLPPDWLVPGVPSPKDLIPRVDIPVFIVHGTADILTAVDHAYRLFNAAHEPKRLWVNDSGHAWAAWTYPDLYRIKVLEFLEASRIAP
jgi:dipeptidyl aminopeptidase/acylaminoacyl peptidase